MKELRLYQCEICSTQYGTRELAEECEKSHRLISSIAASKYRSRKSNPSGYPDTIDIEFDNGEVLRYKR